MTPDTQADFLSSLASIDSVPLHLAARATREFIDGFAVHRNNVQAAPIAALKQAFPVLERLLGTEYFTALARQFVANHPPHSAAWHEYGEGLADFIHGFPPLSHLEYLVDVSRLEWARLRAFHAADARPLHVDITEFQSVEGALSLPLCWHPSVTLLRSAHPLFSLWESQRLQVAPPTSANWRSENVLVWRLGLTLRTEPIATLICDWLDILKSGASLSDVLSRHAANQEEAMRSIATLLQWQAICPAFEP